MNGIILDTPQFQAVVGSGLMFDSSSTVVIGGGDMGVVDMGGMDTGMDIGGDIGGDMSSGTEATVKDPLLSSWVFIGGISAATLAVSIVLGILLAKKRIKKGFDIYEI